MKYPRVAIVTTLCNAEHILSSFVRYHLSTGFDHLFLFFDDPSDLRLHDRFAHLSQTTCFIQGPLLEENWRKVRHRVDKKVYDYVWKEAMARQQLNVAVAIEACLILGIDWLLHIDVDEAFYSPHTGVEDHFRVLDTEGIALCRYYNYEAVPEQTHIQDFFEEATLFKVNSVFNNSHKQADDFVASLSQIPPKFFHFYGNGKTAAKITDALTVRGVHSFGVPQDANQSTADQSQVVLHYPCCGFGHFWDKYKTLGDFGDAWYDTVDIRSRTGPTHLDSRDVVNHGSLEQARHFYKDRFVIDNPETSAELINRGHCTRIPYVQEVLRR